ncbi:HEAT repeat domain-containing protein [Streptomyces coeruleorubidus]|jgi:HEAT repeat protein|uniref:HEAT repeat domain-containing protein n=1 Tax=Streptomyces coeruleorubidus TaxID=116188 RepID=UPI0033CBBF68
MGADQQIAFLLRESEAPDPERRAAAVKGLGRTGGAGYIRVLTEAAGDPAPTVRAAAALALGRLGDPEAGGEALVPLMEDADPRVRRRASVAAIRLGLRGPAVTQSFARLLSDPDHHLRINALDGLAALGVPGDVAALVGLLGDPDFTVWGRARSLVHRFGDDAAVRAEVIRTARRGPGAARVRALDLLPDRCTEQLLDSLLTGLGDPSAEVRKAVARRLFDVARPEVRDALAAALRTERDPGVAAYLLRRLGGLGDERVTGPAVRWLRDPEAGAPAAHALAEAAPSTAAAHLRTVMADRTVHPRPRAAAATAVGAGGGWDAVWLLLPLLDDPDDEVRAGAIDGLGELVWNGLRPWERRPVARALVARLAAGGPHIWRARNALDGLTQALPAVRRLADGAASGEVRAAALSLLDGDDETDEHTHDDVRRFLRGLDDPHEPVRYEAVLGLGRWVEATGTLPPGSEEAHSRLTALTTDASHRLRHAAAGLLEALDTD